MRKYLIPILLVLLVAFGATAFALEFQGRIGVSITACSNATDADLLCEDWDGQDDCGNDTGNNQTCRNTWSWVNNDGSGGGYTIDNPVTSNCPDAGPHSLEIDVNETANGGVEQIEAYSDFGSESLVYTTFMLKVTDDTGFDDTEFARIFTYGEDGWAKWCNTRLYYDDPDIILQLQNEVVDTDTGTTVLSVGTWYEIQVNYSDAANTCTVYIDDVAELSVAQTAGTMKFYNIGAYEPTGQIEYEIDSVKMDDDASPDSCAGG